MNAKKISALLLAAAMMIPCAAPAQVYAAETAQEETEAQDAEVDVYKRQGLRRSGHKCLYF